MVRVHLVDGTYELFRAHFGSPSRIAPDGTEMGATYGLARSMLRLVGREGATHVAVAFDHVIESFRNDLFDGYKRGDGIEPELWAQFGPAERICEALGFTVWPMVEFEADDALAAGADRYAKDPRVEQVLLCTPDKDLAQCVRDDRVVLWDRRRDIVLDREGVRGKYGVYPESIPDWLALVGDTADGIPGLAGWGAKSAAAVLAEYTHFEAIPEDPDAWSVPVRSKARLAERLATEREAAELWRTLARLRTDVPLEEPLDALEWRGIDRERLSPLATEFGMERLLSDAPGPQPQGS